MFCPHLAIPHKVWWLWTTGTRQAHTSTMHTYTHTHTCMHLQCSSLYLHSKDTERVESASVKFTCQEVHPSIFDCLSGARKRPRNQPTNSVTQSEDGNMGNKNAADVFFWCDVILFDAKEWILQYAEVLTGEQGWTWLFHNVHNVKVLKKNNNSLVQMSLSTDAAENKYIFKRYLRLMFRLESRNFKLKPGLVQLFSFNYFLLCFPDLI